MSLATHILSTGCDTRDRIITRDGSVLVVHERRVVLRGRDAWVLVGIAVPSRVN